jgi:hypothetical protein
MKNIKNFKEIDKTFTYFIFNLNFNKKLNL